MLPTKQVIWRHICSFLRAWQAFLQPGPPALPFGRLFSGFDNLPAALVCLFRCLSSLFCGVQPDLHLSQLFCGLDRLFLPRWQTWSEVSCSPICLFLIFCPWHWSTAGLYLVSPVCYFRGFLCYLWCVVCWFLNLLWLFLGSFMPVSRILLACYCGLFSLVMDLFCLSHRLSYLRDFSALFLEDYINLLEVLPAYISLV